MVERAIKRGNKRVEGISEKGKDITFVRSVESDQYVGRVETKWTSTQGTQVGIALCSREERMAPPVADTLLTKQQSILSTLTSQQSIY